MRPCRRHRAGAVLAVAVVMAAAFSGCILYRPAPSAGPDPSASPLPTPEPTPAPSPLSMMVSGSKPPMDSPVLTELCRQAGVSLTVRAVSEENYTASLQVALTSGSRYDIMEITPAQAYPYRSLFRNVASLFEQYAPNYMAWVRETGIWDQLYDQPDWISIFPGHIDTRRIDGGWWIRDDLTAETDPAALFAAAAAESGTLGLSVPGGVLGLLTQTAPLFGVSADVYVWQDAPVYGPTTAAFQKALLWLHDCYASGSLDPAFSVRTQSSWQGLASSRRLAVTMCSFELWEELANDGYVLSIPPTLSDVKPKIATLSGRTIRWMALSTTCEYPEAAVGFIDFCFSNEGQLLQNYGLDGVHASVYDGHAVLIEPWKSAGIPALQAQGLLSPVLPGIRYGEENALSPELRAAALKLRISYLFPAATRYQQPLLRGEEAEEKLLLEGTLWPLAQRWWTDFITGAQDPAADWAEYLQALNEAGLSQWLQ